MNFHAKIKQIAPRIFLGKNTSAKNIKHMYSSQLLLIFVSILTEHTVMSVHTQYLEV